MAKIETTHNSSGSQWTTATIWGNALLFLLCLLKKMPTKGRFVAWETQQWYYHSTANALSSSNNVVPVLKFNRFIQRNKPVNMVHLITEFKIKVKKKNSQQVRQTGASIASTCKLHCYCTCKPYKFRQLLIQ